jgi:AcrR family transcriptional regulator
MMLQLLPPPPAPSPRRAAILEAALDCFYRLGYANATIDDVRRASGASVGSIYHHFGDKEGIAGALYVEGLRRYQSSLLGAAEGFRGPRGLIRGIVMHYIDWTLENPAWARFLFETRRVEGVAAAEPEIRRETRGFFDRLAARFARSVEHGEIRSFPMEVTAAILIGPAQELARHWLRAGIPDDIEPVRRALADAAWRALKT